MLSCRQPRRSLRLLGLTVAGELVSGAEDPCGPQLATAAAERLREKGEGDGRTGRLLSLKRIHTLAHLIIFSSINTQPPAEEGRSRSSRRWVWTFPSFVLDLFIKDRDCTPPNPHTPVVFSMRIMVQWMCEVGAFFRDNILVVQPDWVATRCKTPPSNVDAQLTPLVAFPFNLFSNSDAALGASEADGALQPVHPLHHILWSNLQEGKRNVLIVCCADWMRWFSAAAAVRSVLIAAAAAAAGRCVQAAQRWKDYLMSDRDAARCSYAPLVSASDLKAGSNPSHALFLDGSRGINAPPPSRGFIMTIFHWFLSGLYEKKRVFLSLRAFPLKAARLTTACYSFTEGNIPFCRGPYARTEQKQGECTAAKLHLVPWGHFWLVIDSQSKRWLIFLMNIILVKEMTLLLVWCWDCWSIDWIIIKLKKKSNDLISMLISIWYNACETYGLTPDPQLSCIVLITPYAPSLLCHVNAVLSLKGLCCLHTDVCRVILLLSGWESIANSLVVSFPVGPHAIVLQRCMRVWSLMCNRYTTVCGMQHVIGRVDHTWRQNNPRRGRFLCYDSK